MPQFNGLRALELLKESGLPIPFILISGTIGEDTAVRAMTEGAADYLLKDRLARLGAAVDRATHESRLRRERRQAEEALQLFHTLVDQSTDSFEVIDPSTARFLDVNGAGFKSLGYSREEFLSLRVFDIDPTIEEKGWPELVAKMRAEGTYSGEGSHRRKDGSSFPVECNVRWVKLEREYLVAVVRDISERKEMETRTFRAQRMESIGSLAGGIAHDMNNILAPILMSSTLLRQEMSAESKEQMLAAIEQCAQRGSDLIKQLLTFGRGSESVRIPVQPTVLIHEVVRIARQTFPKNISVVEATSGSLWPVVGDPTQIHQILLNLCVNARDAMPQGGTLQVGAADIELDEAVAAATPGAHPGRYVLIQVTDNGTGIPADRVARIFDPFFTTKAVGKGTGLGLSTAIGLVKNHGGFLTVKSQMGEGSAFHVHLPAAAEGKRGRRLISRLRLRPATASLILVVDDEQTIREVVLSVLEKYGYRVVAAANGADAVSIYAAHRDEIKAVVTDLDMPLMDGIMLMHVLRKINPQAAVLVSSGVASTRGTNARRTELEALGIRILLEKPYTVDTLLRAVHGLLSEHQ